MKLKIYTQNCFGIPWSGNRLKKIAIKIVKEEFDVVFLQEIQWKRNVPIFDLPKYQMFFDNGLYATAGGLLTLLKKDFLGEHGFVKFKAQGGVRQIADRALGKGILDVVLAKERIHLINTHFMATYLPGRFRDKAQEKQLEQFLEYVKDLKKFVAAGDLNFSDESQSYQKLLLGVADFSRGIGKSHILGKIDFVVGRGVKKVLKKEFVSYDGFVSDHKGILAELEI